MALNQRVLRKLGITQLHSGGRPFSVGSAKAFDLVCCSCGQAHTVGVQITDRQLRPISGAQLSLRFDWLEDERLQRKLKQAVIKEQ